MDIHYRLNSMPGAAGLDRSTTCRFLVTGPWRSPLAQSLKLLFWSSLGIGLCFSLAEPLRASEVISPRPPAKSAQYRPPTPPNLGTPKGRVSGGASRGICKQSPTMQALIPQGNRTEPWALTISERPTFWFYLPSQLSADTPLEFVLQDPDDQYIYKTVFTPPKSTASVISIELPPESPPLVLGLLYTWTLSLPCDPSRPSNVAFIRGTLRRSPLASTPSLQPSPNLGMIQRFSEQGFWYDALTLAAQAYHSQPADVEIAQVWQQLLRQVGLEKADSLADPCCGKAVYPGAQTALSP